MNLTYGKAMSAMLSRRDMTTISPSIWNFESPSSPALNDGSYRPRDFLCNPLMPPPSSHGKPLQRDDQLAVGTTGYWVWFFGAEISETDVEEVAVGFDASPFSNTRWRSRSPSGLRTISRSLKCLHLDIGGQASTRTSSFMRSAIDHSIW